jgi:hypothetical protein
MILCGSKGTSDFNMRDADFVQQLWDEKPRSRVDVAPKNMGREKEGKEEA